MEGALAELGRQLLRYADPALLDLPLDLCCDRVADDDAREILRDLHEAGSADTVRDLFDGDLLARWARERCTLREEESLRGELSRWLGVRASGADDPERLVELPEPPDEPTALERWAERYEVVALLSSHPAGSSHSLFDLCTGRARSERGASLLALDTVARDARARLWKEAASKRALQARTELHALQPTGRLGALALRLRARFESVALATLHEVRFVPARPLALEPERALARGFALSEAGPREVRLYLSGFEQRALESECACGNDRCVHAAAVAARLFEAAVDERDRLHAALSEFVRVPSWQRFVAALREPERRERSSRIVFAVRREGERVAIGALLRRGRDAAPDTPGKLASPRSLARSAHADDRDREVLAALSAATRTLAPQFVPADLPILRSLIEHPSLELHPEREPLRVREESVRVVMVEQPDGVTPLLELAGKPLALPHESERMAGGFVTRLEGQTLIFAAITPLLARFARALDAFRGVLPPESYPLIAPLLQDLRASADVTAPKVLEGFELAPPDRLLMRVTPLADEGIDVQLTVRTLPLAPLWSPGVGPELVHGAVEGVHRSLRRRLDDERDKAKHVVAELELERQLSLGSYSYRVDTTEGALRVLSAAARLSTVLEIEWAERSRPLTIAGTVQAGSLKVELFKRGDFLSLQGAANVSDRRVPLERLLEAARNGERFVAIEGDDYAEIEQALFERLERAQLCVMPNAKKLLSALGAVSYLRNELERLDPGDVLTAEWLTRSERDEDVAVPELAIPLRPYQREGAAFLLRASRWSTGACLADEMGLGKTLQSIALLEARAELGPQLVIAPTSVVENWMREIDRASRKLAPLRYVGAKRRIALAGCAAGSVLITSYDIALRDQQALAPLGFATVVLDEAQWLKNARTRRARAVAAIPADFRVALTGTPIENRLADLFSLYHLLAPGLLGSWSLFRARFAVPIERYENRERAAALRALVRPLLLRREKAEVASELPPRTDVVYTIELTPAERDLYSAALEHARRALGRRKGPDDTSRVVRMLAELTRLRLLACHPRLVVQESRVSSSKMRALLALLDDLLPRGHRILIFSQFVRHLALVREELAQREVRYLYLDGRVPARERVVAIDAFQRGEAPLFLISLKAGGTGLNLTAADYVVHLDPWWNPAAEDQASDRAHRIGQRQPVTVVRMVAQGTIEQRVLALHEHKRRLASDVLGDAAPRAAAPNANELEQLLTRECEATDRVR